MSRAVESFLNVPTQPHPTREGTVEMPIRYRDSTIVTAVYRIDPERVRPLLAPAALQPIGIGGKALMTISWCEYRQTTIGPYNELAVAVLAHHGPRPPSRPLRRMGQPGTGMGVHILHLPVTTPIAWAAGCEFWGFPKTVDEIPYRWQRRRLEASLVSQGRAVIRMQAKTGPGLPVKMTDLVTLSIKEGALIETHTRIRAWATVRGGRGTTLEVLQPDHPIGRTLTQLDLPPHPTAVFTCNPMPAILPFGRVLDRPTPPKRAA